VLRYGAMPRCSGSGAPVTRPAVACACPAACSSRRGWPPHRAR
jgi:hypothetical protein